jgi:thiol-disulfide isomerase/thioredoxin
MKQFIFITILIGMSMSGSAQIKRGQQAPELSLPNLQGNLIPLSGFKGKVVLIDFWASWCVPCRKNNPHLVQLYKKYHGLGLEIYGVSIDDHEMNWKEAVQHDQLEWIQVNDNRGWNAPSIVAYDLNAIPTSFLLDKKGVIREVDLTGHKLESEIKSLLKK